MRGTLIRRSFAAAAACTAAVVLAPASGSGADLAPRPNVVVITTDDQTYDSLRFMPRVRSLLGAQGMTFTRNFASLPLCCPSRVTFLTGQYAHNHGVLFNDPPKGGFPAFHDATDDLPLWLQAVGYRTALVGKYLNGYPGALGPTEVQPGWNDWFTPVIPGDTAYYDYTMNDNGVLVPFGHAPADYSTDVLADRAVSVVNSMAPQPEPFFLWFTPRAPHTVRASVNPNPPPAPRHIGAYASEQLPRPPSFNERDISDKPRSIGDRPSLSQNDILKLEARYRAAIESLLAEDEAVERIVNALDASGEMANTLIIFTSDNGYFYGEHRLVSGKERVYEEATHVPLIMRGPGIPPGTVRGDLTANIDLASTIADAANATPQIKQDGISLLPLARNPGTKSRRKEILFEARSYSAVRTRRYVYARYKNGAEELYDLKHDPYEIKSLDDSPKLSGIKARLARQLAALRDCAGKSCRGGVRNRSSSHG
ncbi:MAG: N-acetylglucosamine-6-sulfatase [Thermoleophilaceae bacterium]|nr:N-acetylglucosamine-6-sulfatase [Thermoleophilaceae bacterium]